jgi:NAD(P) transhydrogenase subunit alpha
VLVLGAGVAGLQAIATAKRLGAIVTGFDIRRAAWEQIGSLGGRPLELDFIPDAEGEGGYARPLTEEENEQVRDALAENAARQDVIITTAAIPGRPAPLLITADAVRNMAPGSVIGIWPPIRWQLRADRGRQGRRRERRQGRRTAQPRPTPGHASQLYAKNLENLLGLMITDEGALELNFEDDIIDAACIAREGELRGERTAK